MSWRTAIAGLYGADGVRLHGQVKAVRFGRCAADSLECSRLRLQAGAEVYRLRRIREQRGESFLLEDVVLPVELFPGLSHQTDVAHEIGILAQRYGILLGKAEERVTVGIPPPDVAELLHNPPGDAMMRLDRTVVMLDGRSVEWRIAYCRIGRSFYLAEMK